MTEELQHAAPEIIYVHRNPLTTGKKSTISGWTWVMITCIVLTRSCKLPLIWRRQAQIDLVLRHKQTRGRDSVCFGSPIFALPTSIALTFQVSFIYTACSYTQQSWSFTAENGNQTDDLKSKILETLSIDVFTRCPCRLPASQSISIHNTCWDMDYWVNTLLIGIAPLGEVPSLWLKSTGTLRLWMYLWWANITVQHPPPSAHDQSHLEILEEPCKHKNMMLSF